MVRAQSATTREQIQSQRGRLPRLRNEKVTAIPQKLDGSEMANLGRFPIQRQKTLSARRRLGRVEPVRKSRNQPRQSARQSSRKTICQTTQKDRRENRALSLTQTTICQTKPQHGPEKKVKTPREGSTPKGERATTAQPGATSSHRRRSRKPKKMPRAASRSARVCRA